MSNGKPTTEEVFGLRTDCFQEMRTSQDEIQIKATNYTPDEIWNSFQETGRGPWSENQTENEHDA